MKNLSQLKQLSSPLSILYIEDNLKLQKILSSHLQQLFSKVFQAYDAADGIMQYILNKPDIIVTDLTLSKQNSFSMIMQIQDISQKVFIIVLSEKDDNYELLQSLDIKNIAFLSKPLNVDIFNKILFDTLSNAFPPKKEIDKSIALLYKIMQERKSIMAMNHYKGILISQSANLFFYENSLLKVQVTHAQIIAAIHEKQMILEYNNQYILCELADINKISSIATLQNPLLINYHKRSLKDKRIDVDGSFKISLGIRNINFEVTALTISFNFITIISRSKISFQKNDSVDLSVGFEINGPSSLLKEKKFTKVFGKGQIIRIDQLENSQRMILQLSLQKAGENVFRKYLQQRELEIIKEFKIKIRR